MDDMIKLLIVDDEPLARLRISSFDLEPHGFKVIGEAENGQEALRLVPVLKPDIIVTDIMMPIMDGLQLLTEIQKLENAPKVVLLTCYDDFSKAQAALRLGALDYIVKIMLKEEDFVEVINKAARVIQKEKQNVRKAVRKTLNDLMLTGYKAYCSEYVQQLSEMGFNPKLYRFILLEMTQSQLLAVEAHKLSIENWEDEIRCIVVSMMPKYWTVFLYTQSGLSGQQFSGITLDFCRNFLDKLGSGTNKEKLGCRIIAGETNCDVSRLTRAYNSVYEAQKLLFYTGREETIILESKYEGFFKSMPGAKFQDYIDKFRENYSNGQGKAASECMLSWMDSVRNEFRPLPEDVKIMASLFSTCIPDNFGYEYGKCDLNNESKEDGADNAISLQQWMKAGIETSSHIDDICGIFERVAECLRVHLKNSEAHLRAEIRKALEFIHDNFRKDISLEMVAEHVRLSASWFGNLFRTETHQTFSEYLSSYRMAAAKRLLEQTDLPISQIADEVGINDPHYFSRMFTRSTGQCPKEYRNRLRA